MMTSGSMSVMTGVLVLGVIMSSVQACFIRNCPRGGKRSIDVISHECMRCGPDGKGQCIGPNICCGPEFGCHISSKETQVCQQENQDATPCVVRGAPCGAENSGNCVADGICCDEVSCASNERCRQTSSAVDGQTKRSDILQLIHKLLQVRDYD
ncbi:conopressin/neurophysin-like [Physella acuta]|uniref:conopressin/neurophysin-like n=1 Tax=Physella acuta TaxID=109671 RepID=UPI0027DDF341|nr:conopressin/neurophysin-like [Physella acuta]